MTFYFHLFSGSSMSGPQASDGSRDASGIISSASSLKKLYRYGMNA